MPTTLAVSELRKRIADHIAQVETPVLWRQSGLVYDNFPGDPGNDAHCTFAVGVTSTEFASELESSRHKRGSTGGRVTSRVVVRWLVRVRADNQVEDLDAAYDAEGQLVQALADRSLLQDGEDGRPVHVMVLAMTRRSTGDGTWLLGEMTLRCDHLLAIQPV